MAWGLKIVTGQCLEHQTEASAIACQVGAGFGVSQAKRATNSGCACFSYSTLVLLSCLVAWWDNGILTPYLAVVYDELLTLDRPAAHTSS
jgi:hypothetical protein